MKAVQVEAFMLTIFQSVGLFSTVLAAVLLLVLPRKTPAPVRARRAVSLSKAPAMATSRWGQLQAR